MSSPYSALAAKVRAKFPGQYDDLSDDDLGKKVITKHPEYQDLVRPVEPTPKPGALGRPAMPGTASKYAGPQSKALTPEQRSSREIPREVMTGVTSSVMLPAVAEAALPGGIAAALTRGASGVAGASYGGNKAREFGLPKWAGQVAGGVAGLFAPEVIGKLSGPIISKIATVLGKSAPEVATEIAADPALVSKVGRDVVERAASGQPLTDAEEELLLKQVQQHYTPESGVEQSASQRGKVYAARGRAMQPTNEQIELATKTGKSGMTPPPGAAPKATIKTDSLGVRWASSPESPNPVSIPKSVPEGEVQQYATQKLQEQARMARDVKAKVSGGMTPPPNPPPVATGGSGESDASLESIKRQMAEQGGGVKYFRVKPGGQRIPWIGNDPGTATLNPGEKMIRVNTKTGEEFFL